MKKISLLFLATLVILFTYGPAQANLLVSGDSNIADALVGSVDTGNQQFFTNILRGGTSVAVLQSTVVYGGGTASGFVNEVNQFYNGLAGVTSNVLSGTIDNLSGYDLFVAPLPDNAFTTGEIAVLSTFLAAGNSVFFLGENSNADFTASNTNINNALTALGSGMQIVPDVFDSGYHVAIGSQIATDLYTEFITHFTYAAPSQVSGGKTLLYGTGEEPFIAYETTSVPEPATLLLFGSSLVGIFGLRRKFRI